MSPKPRQTLGHAPGPPDTESPLVRFLRSLVRRRPKPGQAGESAKPKLLHKSLTLRRSHGPGSLAEHDWLVAAVGARGARDVEQRGAAHIAACIADPWKYQNEPAGRPR